MHTLPTGIARRAFSRRPTTAAHADPPPRKCRPTTTNEQDLHVLEAFLQAGVELSPSPLLEYLWPRQQCKCGVVIGVVSPSFHVSESGVLLCLRDGVEVRNPTPGNSGDPIATRMHRGRVGLASTSARVALGEPCPARVLQCWCQHALRIKPDITDFPGPDVGRLLRSPARINNGGPLCGFASELAPARTEETQRHGHDR